MAEVGSWNRDVDYNLALSGLMRRLGSKDVKHKCYAAVALTQLYNGALISEAIDGFLGWLATGKNVVKVKARMKKHRKGRAKREIRIPLVFEDMGIREACKWMASLGGGGKRQIYDGVLYRLKRYLGYNTHSLRYAYIRRGLAIGLDPATVAKMVNQENPLYLRKYVEQYEREVSSRKQQ